MRTQLGVVGALALAGALGLAGCAPATTAAAPSSTSTAPPSAVPTPAPAKPTLAQLVVSPDGLGYLVAGEPVRNEPAAAAIVSYDPTKCVNTDGGLTVGSPGAGAWLSDYPDGDTWAGRGAPFDVGPVASETDPISEIEIWSPELKTVKHLGVGSTPAQLTAAYGAALSLDSADNSDVYILRGASTQLLFEVAKPDSGLPAAEIGTVVWMRIVPIEDTGLHIANTDVAGPCAS
jgi:hypothetical protein